MKERRRGYCGDISFSSVYDLTAFILIIIVIVWVIVGLLVWAAWSEDYANDIKHNEQATEFNARPLSERVLIADYIGGDDFDENHLMTLEEVGLTGGKAAGNWTLLILVLALIALPIVTFISYCHEKDSDYYLADLPLSRPYGWLLLFSMFVMWPVLFIAFLHMWYLERSNIHKAIVEKRQKTEEERKQVEMMAKRELKQEEIERAQHCGHFSSRARRQYFVFRRIGYQKSLDHQKKETNKLISDYQNQLRSLGKQLQTVQKQMGEAKAKLASLEHCSSAEQNEKITEEWRLITEMRGVSRISFDRKDKEKRYLCILVKVRVPYENVLYDFGDFEIKIGPQQFSCVEVRSGVKANASSHTPRYRVSDGFCFGSRRDDILDFVQHARMLEAITLAIDCLHSVNSGDEVYIPRCFRTVDSIETAKRRLARRQRR